MLLSDFARHFTKGLWTSLSAVLLLSCEKAGEAQLITIEIQPPTGMQTRSAIPDEERISDLNLYIYSEDGILEESRYVSARETEGKDERITLTLPLVRGIRESIVCCANFGYRLTGAETLEEMKSCRYYMAYPDEYSRGMPMSCIITDTWSTEDDRIVLRLERMMAKLSVAMDRSALDNGVRITARSVKISNCPKSAGIAGPSSARGSSDVFSRGFIRSGPDADALNMEVAPGLSGEVSVYMMENMMGDLLDDTTDDNGKVPGGGLSASCSFIEIECEYISHHAVSRPGEYLTYRFYPGENNWNFDIQRNCHYHFTVQPYGDGLGDGGWRVDTSAIE